MIREPDYSEYNFAELCQALDGIDADRHPQRVERIKDEIRTREPPRLHELITCLVHLNHEKWPDETRFLHRLIDEREEEIAERYKPKTPTDGTNIAGTLHRNFWRRCLANLVDLLAFAVTLSLASAWFVVQFPTAVDMEAFWRFAIQILNVVGLAWYLFYLILPQGRSGRSGGKWVAGVHLVDKTEGRPGYVRALVRDLLPFGAMIAAAVLLTVSGPLPDPDAEPTQALLGWLKSPVVLLFFLALPLWLLIEVLTMPLNRRQRAVQDWIAGTQVLRCRFRRGDQ
ncbi:MAG: RDD family protein [Gammaproteobacteria bacterium]